MTDPKQLVASSYDAIVERYAGWQRGVRGEEREYYTRVLLDSVPAGAPVLELGCGNGLPTGKTLAAKFSYTGVDISPRQVERARVSVPQGTFLQADMTELAFQPETFAAVAAFYSITHVPRDEHARLLQLIMKWLRPGGLFVAAMGSGSTDGVEEDWLGVPMYFSHFDAETNRRLVADAGFEIISAQAHAAEEFGQVCTFLWVVARKR